MQNLIANAFVKIARDCKLSWFLLISFLKIGKLFPVLSANTNLIKQQTFDNNSFCWLPRTYTKCFFT